MEREGGKVEKGEVERGIHCYQTTRKCSVNLTTFSFLFVEYIVVKTMKNGKRKGGKWRPEWDEREKMFWQGLHCVNIVLLLGSINVLAKTGQKSM